MSSSFDGYMEEEEFWDYYEYFITELPVAEAANVKLSVHPNDPPIPSLGGIPLFRSKENFDRALGHAALQAPRPYLLSGYGTFRLRTATPITA